MRKRLSFIFYVIITVAFVAACSDEKQVNPEDTINDYITAWENQNYEAMEDALSEDSQDEYDWEFRERFEKIHGDLGIEAIDVHFESINFEEEEIDLDEIDTLNYDANVQMKSRLGDISYSTNITLLKTVQTIEDEEVDVWKIEWHPSHLFIGLQENNDQIHISTESPERGTIYDRNGQELAVNGEIYEAGFVPERLDDFDEATKMFAEILNLNIDTVRDLADNYPDNPDWFAPVQQLSLTDPRTEQLLEIPGVLLNRKEGREYPYGEEFAHLIGYIGPITAEELEEREGEQYETHSVIGKRGLEIVLEEQLRGKPGVTVTVFDNEGNTRDIIIKEDPVHGEDITLTVDAHLQRQLAETLSNNAGAGVVMNPSTGEVLALASLPAYDSNLRYLRLPDPRAEDIDDSNTLLTRRFQQAYSPGSVFKPFTAAAGLEEGTLDPGETIHIDGKQWQADESWGNYRVTRVNEHVNEVNFKTAMEYSDNIYFAQQALALGVEQLEAWAERFGFGKPMPFGFPMYASTLTNDGITSDVLLADTGYGQGQVQMPPVHLASLYTMFVNDGNIPQPRLFDDESEEMWKENLISEETATTVLNSLIAVVEDRNGTAFRENLGHTRNLAGKTGTAELKQSQDDDDSNEELGWYVALDYEEEDLLVTVVVENVENKGGSGYVVDLVNEFIGNLE
ncbi:penicillin-binding transpeptidase domain-containing protein [Bacillus shivajii]|uniref:penicillin-binding transpeptidase domain-containing protein n=1 Tax=Bacillus shivajii TaxID=1983719 RepID=UPI001CFB46B6|nr:penicillin-binding transpeptidase domain-containing protein [Bacillus shivajii]UCZ52966.1 penicillin-binding transpeptidase domain-containing protein [Bacillus shivajii]